MQRKEYRKKLIGFPEAVVNKMLERQAEYTTQMRKVNEGITELEIYPGGAFYWEVTPEGWEFWNRVIGHKDFDHFYTLYPQVQQLKLF